MREIQLKNKPALAAGLVTAVISLLFLPETLQFISAMILGIEYDVSFWLIFPQTTLKLSPDESWIVYLGIEAFPILYLIIACELSGFILRKSYPGTRRYATIVFLLVYTGYMIIYMFINAISIIIRKDFIGGFEKLIVFYKVTEIYSMVYVFAVIIILSFYINLVTKRVLGYINY